MDLKMCVCVCFGENPKTDFYTDQPWSVDRSQRKFLNFKI